MKYFVLIMILGLAISSPVYAQSYYCDPEKMYHKAWWLIQADYYDPQHNGQNWSHWEHRYDRKLKTLEDARKAIDTMLASLAEPGTFLLPKDAVLTIRADSWEDEIPGDLGLSFERNGTIVKVKTVNPGSIAARKVRVGDELLQVNNKPARLLTPEQLGIIGRGSSHTPVQLAFLTSKGPSKLDLFGERPANNRECTVLRIPHQDDLIYARIHDFNRDSLIKELPSSLKSIAPGARGMILDLRHSKGGMLSSAIEIANMFLEEQQIIVSTVDRDGYKTAAQSEGKPIARIPIVILINRGTEGSAEILAAALQGNGRGLIVGSPSRGAHLIHQMNGLEDGSRLRFPVAQWLTPRDRILDQSGIQPDVLAPLSNQQLLEGKGPWWRTPQAQQEPDMKTMKDIQLIRAVGLAMRASSAKKKDAP